jgi:transcriptional regulator with XRE-family HTH domain
MSVGSELRRARETRHLTLREISQATKIKIELLTDLENDDVSRWPTQKIYRHGHLRAYALAVGLDPVMVAEKFDDQHGDPVPVAFHGAPSKSIPSAWVRIVGNTMLAASLAILIAATIRLLPPLNPPADSRTPDRQYAPVAREIDAIVPAADSLSSAAPSAASEISTGEEMSPADIEGEIRIVSIPSDAHVTVNGIGRGPTPLRVRYLPLGSYTIRVIRPGFKIRETQVTLKEDRPNRTVRVVLQDQPAYARATLRASSDGR